MAQYNILELSEQASATKKGNGDYSVVVAPSTTLEEGDIVSLEKAFLDTSAQASQKINIPDGGITLDFTVGYYLDSVRGWVSMDTSDMDDYADAPGVDSPFVDGKTYVLCKDATQNANLRVLSNFLIVYNDGTGGLPANPGNPANSPNPADYYVEFIYTIQFTDGTGRVQTGTVSSWDLDWTSLAGGRFESDTQAKNILFDPTAPVRVVNVHTGRVSGDETINNQKVDNFWPNNQLTQFTYQYNIAASGYAVKFDGGFYIAPDAQTGVAEDNITPLTFSTEELGLSVKIAQGNYTPTDLAQVINDALARNYAQPSVNNEILKSAFLLNYSSDRAPFTDTRFVSVERDANGAPLASFKIAPNAGFNGGLLVGATQMELNYDEDREQYFWSYLHTPFLSGPAPNVESVQITQQTGLKAPPDGPGNNSMLITRNGGVFFTSCRSVDANGKDVNFWENILGWGNRTNSATQQPTFITKNAAPFTGNIRNLAVTNLFLPESLETGKFTTTGYDSISSIQTLTTNDPPGAWWHMPDLAAPYSSQTNASVPIFSGHEDISNDTTDVGYYLVEVSGVGAGNELKSGGMYLNRQIMGIVSGFFARDSFTTGTGSDSLSYVHRGQPIALEGFSVRILAPNKEVALNLGGNNSVMLRITKAPQPTTPPLREEQS